jgi:5'-nucleotidase/UDP-sugar diphosphatase
MKRRDLLKAGLATGLAAAGLSRAQGGAVFRMTIIHTNDTHAHIDPVELTLNGQKVKVGGVARRIHLYDQLRTSETNPLFLHAGDVFQGTLYFTQYRGLADRYFMHREGVRVMALGNHEFDLGPDALAAFLDGARFPVLGANVDVSKEPKLSKVQPYTVVRVGGQNIGIVGLTTPDTAIIANPGPTVSFTDPAAAAQKAINELLARGVNKIVILSHLGYLADLELGKKIVGAQVIVGGHSHTLLGSFEANELQSAGPYPTIVKNPEGRDVLVVQAWEWGKVVGKLNLEFDDKGLLVGHKGEAILVTEQKYREDPYAAEAVRVYALPIAALNAQVVAQTRTLLNGERTVVRRRESNLSNLIADGMLWKTKGASTQIALQNGGGVRATIPAGPITVGKIYEVLPFGNTLVVLDLTGAEVIAALENGVSQWEQGAGRFLSGVAGLRYTFDLAKPAGSRVTKVEVLKGGQYVPIDPAATYRAVVNNFIATGGDGFDSLKNAKGARYDTGFGDAEAFLEYVRSLGTVDAKEEGRITILNEPRAGLEPAPYQPDRFALA